MSTMLLSAVLFGIMGYLVKLLTGYLPAEEIALARFVLALAVILAFRLFRIIKFQFTNVPLLVLRGVLGGIAIVLYFKSISLIPLSDAVVISFAYPMFGTLFAFWFLKEKVKISSITAMAVAFFGIYLISDPTFKQINIGYLYALIGAVFAGGAVVATRSLRKTDNSWSIALALMAGGAIISGIAGMNNLTMPTFNLWGLLVITSIIATAGQLLLIYSYKFVNVLEGGTISMAAVPVAVVLAVAFLGETITLPFLTGASLVFGSTIYLLRSHPGEIIR